MKKNLKICTIGGGTGMPTVNRALVKAGYKNIKSIVTTFDNGGYSGRMRTDERGKIVAYSDYWRTLISLWEDSDQKEVWEEMLKFRDGRDRNFGDDFFQFMTERVGDLSNVDKLFSKLTGAQLKGEVVPVSLEPANICFKTKSGKEYCGENYLDDLRMSSDVVVKMWLKPNVIANHEAVNVILNSDVIIVCPGSIYGSVLINLLPVGMKQAYRDTKARKVLITNLMSTANEDSGFTQEEYVDIFGKYLKIKSPFDLVVMADLKILNQRVLKKVYQNYILEHSTPIKFNENNRKFKTMVVDVAKIEEKNLRLRHSVTKLSTFFGSDSWYRK